jgi:hypothetical protein
MEVQPASQRLPIEIWSMTLHFSIASLLLPFNEPGRKSLQVGIVECLDLFELNCDAYSNYRLNQKTLANLRLVCQSWNRLLQNFSGLCLVTDLRERIGPAKSIDDPTTAERLQIDEEMPRGTCFCTMEEPFYVETCSRTCDIFQYPFRGTHRSSIGSKEFLQEMLHPRIKILTIYTEQTLVDQVLASVPNLLALSLEARNQFQWSEAKNQAFQQVTHLEFMWLEEYVLRLLPASMVLAKLRYLSLDFSLGPRGSLQELPLTQWKYPNLESLILMGAIAPEFCQDICTLLRGSPTYTTGVERACLKDNSTFAIENASAELPVASSMFSRYFAVALVLLSLSNTPPALDILNLLQLPHVLELSRLVLNFSWLLPGGVL